MKAAPPFCFKRRDKRSGRFILHEDPAGTFHENMQYILLNIHFLRTPIPNCSGIAPHIFGFIFDLRKLITEINDCIT